jgi:alpha-2-macroglobulin
MRLEKLLPLLLLFPLACRPHTQPIEAPDVVMSAPAAPLHFVTDPELDGVRVRLSDADDPTDGPLASTYAEGTPLPAKQTAALLARLPDLVDDGGAEFALRKSSKPAPRTGDTVAIPFPPPPADLPPDVVDGPPTVLRYAPEGEVPVAPHLSVTFSQPMIALTTQDEAAKQVPIALEPEPEGQWRWVGTRTVLFEPTFGFPKATTYRASVPAGTVGASGEAIAEATSWQFETPPLRLVSTWPAGGPHALDPVIVLTFDQSIDRSALLPFLALQGGGDKFPLRLATDEEIAADPTAASMAASVRPDRVIALKTKTLPRATSFTITVRDGAPSAEGPRTPASPQSSSFRTFEPLRVQEVRCSWGRECPPEAPWYVRFNNPLTEGSFDPALFAVDPAFNHRVNGNGTHVNISGTKPGRTTYTVTIGADVADTFGQTLGKAESHTIKVGPGQKSLQGPQGLVVLDPSGDLKLQVYTTNHDQLRVRAWAVEPKDYSAVSEWMREWYQHEGKKAPPGRRVGDVKVSTGGVDDLLQETALDLKPFLPAGAGQLVLWIEPTKQPPQKWQRQRLLTWVEATDIGLSAHVDADELIAWATDLSTGRPLADVTVQIEPGGPLAKTSADGTAVLPLPKSGVGPQLLTGRKDGDVAMLPERVGWYNNYTGWARQSIHSENRYFVFDDRGLYKPGETVSIKGYVRRIDRREGGGIDASPLGQLKWTFRGPRGSDIAEGELATSPFGGFELSFELPDDVNLGHGTLQITGSGGLAGANHAHSVQIQEFRRPEFEVKASHDGGPHILGARGTAEVNAKYFAGGGLPSADTTWTVTAGRGSFVPPGRSDWNFGVYVPWWERGGWSPQGQNTQIGRHVAKTDGSGTHRLRLDFEAMNPPQPHTLSLNATVQDVNRQAWTSKTDLLLHPSDTYVGLRTSKPFTQVNKPVDIEAIAVDLDGNASPNATMEVRFARLVWARSGGRWQQAEEDGQNCTVSSGDEGAICTFTPKNGGSYRITATTTDAEGRPNRSQLQMWVAGGKAVPDRSVEQQTVTLVPDGENYEPGDTAELLVVAPFDDAEGLVTWRRQGIVHSERFTMNGATHTLRVPIAEAHVPDLTVQVDLVGAAARVDDDGQPLPDVAPRPAYAAGSITLKIPPLTRTLTLDVAPAHPETEPGATTSIDLSLTHADGEPASDAEIALVVVDESVLSLTGYRVPDPLAVYYALRGPGAHDHHLRAQLLLANPESVEVETKTLRDDDDGAQKTGAVRRSRSRMEGGAPGGGGAMPPPSPSAMMEPSEAMAGDFAMEEDEAMPSPDEAAPDGPAIALRTNFDALAAFEPSIKTDASGHATVELTLPDSLTRYRVMAVAVHGADRFGQGEATITARKPLMVRPSPPRFLNFGDTFELPVVLQNQTDEAMKVSVALRSVGFEPSGAAGQSITVPAQDRVEVRFPAASKRPGEARWQVVAETRHAGAATQDAAEGTLPIWTPATTEAFATYGEIDDGAIKQPVASPPDVWPQFGGLEITTSSTALSALTDAVIYLSQYPYACSEQLASRILAIAALRDVLAAFDAEGLPDPKALEAQVARDIDRIASRQRNDGGFGLWKKHERWQWPYATLHVMHGLVRAEQKGFTVPPHTMRRGLSWLQNVERYIPANYSPSTRRAIRAYALYVLELQGQPNARKAKALLAEVPLEEHGLEIQGWLLPTLHGAGATSDVDAIVRHWENRVAETASGATFVTSYGEDAYLLMHSSRRTDGILLDALIQVRPKSDLVPKVVRALLAHRVRGAWGSTQDNAYVLLALDRYFRVYESVTPDFVARAWLGEGFAGEHTFKGRTTERARIDVPMSWLVEDDSTKDLVLAKDGPGRLYYRLGLKYAPKNLQLEPADRGFVVERAYESVDDAADVSRDDDGTWRIAAGSRVRVRVTMVADARRHHVALIDPMPAGLEAINPDLANTGDLPPDPQSSTQGAPWRWWWGPWYEHDNLRDERAEAFSSLLYAGVYEYTYLARATTPGDFVVPPPKAEEMYEPETFGRGASARVIVE